MTDLVELGKKAREAAFALAVLTTDEKNRALSLVSAELNEEAEEILAANQKDLLNAEQNHMPEGLKDRLLLNKKRISDMADALLRITELPDPIGEILSEETMENGLRIIKKRVPIGVIGIIYEARPNVTSDAFSLCFKSANAVILKGGSDAIHSNTAIAGAIRTGLRKAGITPDALQLIQDTDHGTAERFMQLNGYIDVLIPRGSGRLIQTVLKNATVPVIETGAGNCHIYLDETADAGKAVPVVFNAKTQRIGVCNACESLVVHRSVLSSVLLKTARKLQERDVKIYADPDSYAALSGDPSLRQELICRASEEDFGTEYLDYKISVKTVSDVSEAIRHINRYSTKHSESIITENRENAEKFLNEVDSACVYWNASTRFTDGGCFGFGAEIGISTSKLHARGPMGLRELTTVKYNIIGNGQIR